MHKLIKIGVYPLLLILLSVVGCRGGSETVLEGVAIDMAASVSQSKALIESVGSLQQVSIGIYGYKEQLTNSGNRFMVFDNQMLNYSDDEGWSYSPKRYWDMQTRYSFIAYAPYTSNITSDGTNSIIISDIPQYQNSNESMAKDYVVALSNNSAKIYVENYNKTVNLAFHHILANFQIWAYYEGFDTEFKITGLSIGTDTDGQKVPSIDAQRNYTQQFTQERANGIFNSVIWNGNSVSLPFNGYIVPKETAAQAASFLIVPFVADASGNKKLPLTIEYTKNGVAQKPATVSIGISGFESDNKYRLDLKFESKGAVVVPVDIQIKNWTETVVDPSDIHNW